MASAASSPRESPSLGKRSLSASTAGVGTVGMATYASTNVTAAELAAAAAADAIAAEKDKVVYAANRSVVIQFGSFTTRFGRITDRNPRVIATCAGFLRNGSDAAQPHAQVPPADQQQSRIRRKPARIQQNESETMVAATAAAAATSLTNSVAYSASTPGVDMLIPAGPKSFDEVVLGIGHMERLEERRRGGGKPIPWDTLVEDASAEEGLHAVSSQADESASSAKAEGYQAQHVNGLDTAMERPDRTSNKSTPHDAGKTTRTKRKVFDDSIDRMDLLNEHSYDLVFPVRNGRLAWTEYSRSALEGALDVLICHAMKCAVQDCEEERQGRMRPEGEGDENEMSDDEQADGRSPGPPSAGKGADKFGVVLVVPEEFKRLDIYTLVGAAFRQREIGSVIVHHTSVMASFGAGLSSCVVVDLGHTGGYVACVDDGLVVPESRVAIQYGGRALDAVLMELLRPKLRVGTQPLPEHELVRVSRCLKERRSSTTVTDNDVMATELVHTPSRTLRVHVGIGFRVVPALSLFYPDIFRFLQPSPLLDNHGRGIGYERSSTAALDLYQDDPDSMYFDMLVDDVTGNSCGSKVINMAGAGYFGRVLDGTNWAVDEAIVQSVLNSCEVRQPGMATELRKRLLGAVLVVGGCAGIDGLRARLESALSERVKQQFGDGGAAGATNVEVLLGGKDMPADTLAWKGGAVLAHIQAESGSELWLTAEQWAFKGSTALREKSLFFW
ncbi:Actin-related protein 8 [Porphyridium purpureum]|uniref:Actin-related protein 8 n=1 Tax=Porphyridium purpureum TaxID=35688 RepID=A0A5J4Z1M9_PORPP|nr:Actin-related protein 8 [Porphyridium purpureum]|eukprot:POR7077..scf295_1